MRDSPLRDSPLRPKAERRIEEREEEMHLNRAVERHPDPECVSPVDQLGRLSIQEKVLGSLQDQAVVVLVLVVRQHWSGAVKSSLFDRFQPFSHENPVLPKTKEAVNHLESPELDKTSS